MPCSLDPQTALAIVVEMVIGVATFDDGTTRLVFEAGDGQQYVCDDDGQRVYGIWFLASKVADESLFFIEAWP